MATLVVTSNADSGAGSLRQAIADANPGDTIIFDLPPAERTITLLTQLTLDKDIFINGDIDGDRKADITISGGGATRIFEITGPGTEVTLRSLTLTEGNAGLDFGGAIRANFGTTLAVIDSTVSNSTAGNGGGISVFSVTLRVVNSTLTGNEAASGGGGISLFSGNASLVNATIHANHATGTGGVYVEEGMLTILNSTITENTSGVGVGGVYIIGHLNTATIHNSVVAGNTGGEVDIDTVDGASLTTASSFFGGNPGLGALQDNGGPVQTRAILSGSPLIGAGDATLLPDDDFDLDGDTVTSGEKLPLDARGNARVQGGALDIGATEFAVNTAPVLTGVDSPVTFLENTVNATPQLLDADVAFTDGEDNFDGGTLTVTGLLAEDTVSIRNEGAGAGQIGFDANTGEVSFGNTVIGNAAGGDAGNDLTITFNAAATSAAVDALIQNLTYANASDTPTATRTLTIRVTDADGAVTLGAPSFTEVTGTANPFDGINVGTESAPALGDLDGDGDLDLVVGETDGVLNYFRNDNGVFIALTGAGNNPFDGIDVDTHSKPALADIDGDGDLDLVVGNFYDGTLFYFRNDAGTFTQLTGPGSNPFHGIAVRRDSAPAFGDLDGDGDLDLVLGENEGGLFYFRNDAGTYVELTGPGNNPFDGISVTSQSRPALADIDGDGDLDLVLGRTQGDLLYFRNDGGAFTQQTGSSNPFNGIDVGSFSAPALADIDDDGDLDLAVGELDGNLNFFRNDTPAGIPIVVNVTDESDIGVTIIGSNKADLVDASNTATGQPLPTDLNDIIFGNKGHDNLSGLFGNDTLDGGKGNDILDGGAGNDILQVKGKEGSRDVFMGGPGTDTLQFIGTGTVRLAGFDAAASSIEILQGNGKGLTGTGQNDVFDLSGLSQMTGLLFVDGKGGQDTLLGSAFDDDLRGGGGGDILDGGAGDDILRGGNGRDTFVFVDGYDSDTVIDYKPKQDVFDFTGVSGASSFADLFLTQIDPKTVLIDFDGVLGGDTLTVQKTTIAILTANQGDFLF